MRSRPAIAGLMAAAYAALGCGDRSEAIGREAIENAGFLTIDGNEITLAGGAAVDAGNVRYELLLTADGDLDFDSDIDAAAVLVASDGQERLLTLHALLSDGGQPVDASARLIGDRIEVRRMGIAEGLIRLDVRIRRQGQPVTAAPSVDVTRHFALTDRGLIPVTLIDAVAGDAASAGRGDAGSGTPEAVIGLHTHEWTLESFDSGDWSADLREPDGPVTVGFRPGWRDAAEVSGEVAGFAGCNRIFGSFRTYEGEALRFYGLAVMRKNCGEGQAEFERRFVEALRSVRAFRVVDDRLTLALTGGAIRFRAAGRLAPDTPVANSS